MRSGVYDCYEKKRYICSGTVPEIAEKLGLKEITVRNYASGPGGHRYQMYRWPRREKDIVGMRFGSVPECRNADGSIMEPTTCRVQTQLNL